MVSAERNRLDTGTLGWSDIQNQANYKVKHQSAGFSTGGGIASSLEQQRLKEAQLISEIDNQVTDIARTEGDIAATKAAREKMHSTTEADCEAEKEQWLKANPGKEPTDKDINDQVYRNFYNRRSQEETGLATGAGPLANKKAPNPKGLSAL